MYLQRDSKIGEGLSDLETPWYRCTWDMSFLVAEITINLNGAHKDMSVDQCYFHYMFQITYQVLIQLFKTFHLLASLANQIRFCSDTCDGKLCYKLEYGEILDLF